MSQRLITRWMGVWYEKMVIQTDRWQAAMEIDILFRKTDRSIDLQIDGKKTGQTFKKGGRGVDGLVIVPEKRSRIRRTKLVTVHNIPLTLAHG